MTQPRKSGGRVIESRDLADEYLAKELNRRRLLQGALAVGAAGLGAAGCGDNTNPGGGGGGGGGTDAGTRADVPPMRTTHLVGMGHSEDHVEALDRALAETTGFDFVQRGQRVYLKVNTNSGDAFPYSTSPDTIRWVVEKIRARGGEPFIGDRSFFGDRNTMSNFTRNGIKGIADELEVPIQVFGDRMANDATAVDWVDLPTTVEGIGARSQHWEGTMRIPAVVAMADHIVTLPVVKTHFIATFTMAMKNMIGIVNPVDRSRTRNLGSHDGSARGRLFPQVAFMNKAGPTVSLNVLDGWNALISGGPTPTDRPPGAPAGAFRGVTGEPHVVIISRDRVAADLTGAAVLRTVSPMYELIHSGGSLWDNRQLRVAIAAGVGITERGQYDLSGPTVPNIAEIRRIATE